MASKKDLRPLMKTAREQGWVIDKTRGGHLRWTAPSGGVPYFSSSTPSDVRAVRNIETALGRMGLRTS